MKKVSVLCVVMVAVAIAGLLPAQEVKGPRIAAKDAQYDFGKVVQGTQVSHVFEVRNAGNEPLIIDRVVPS